MHDPDKFAQLLHEHIDTFVRKNRAELDAAVSYLKICELVQLTAGILDVMRWQRKVMKGYRHHKRPAHFFYAVFLSENLVLVWR